MKSNERRDIVNMDDLANRLFFRLYQCANVLHKTGTRALEDTGITTQQWAIMGALARPGTKEGIAVGDLTRFLMVSRQNLTGVLSRLESQQLITRMVSPSDSRSRLVCLTDKGRALWNAEMQQKIAGFYDSALEGFSSTDKIHMIHYLDKALQNMRALDSEG